MALQEEQMLLLEQITYFDQKNCFDYMGINAPEKSELLHWILHPTYSNGDEIKPDDFMKLLDKIPNDSGDMEIDGSEWKSIISAIRSDSDFASLRCVEYNGDAKAFWFENKDDNTATVVFQGTAGRWKDDVDGLYMVNTNDQIIAREFVERIGAGYESVDLVGHSKGGNLAQYATITADYSKVNINRCISMDGQGFCKEFIDTYSDQIKEHGGSIKNYCYKDDFVNIFLNKVPGAQQIYCEGNDVGVDNHFSNSMFEVINNGTEENPCWNVIWRETEPNAGMEYLHDFTCYLANNMPLNERTKLGGFIGDIVQGYMDLSDKLNDPKSGLTEKQISDQLSNYLITKIKSNPKHASILLAYFIKYSNEKGITDEQLYSLLKAFGMNDEDAFRVQKIISLIKKYIVEHPTEAFLVSDVIHGLSKILGVNEIKGLDIDELSNYISLVYGYYAKIKDDDFVEGDYVPENIAVGSVAAVVSASVSAAASAISGISKKTIKVDPEILRAQSDELFAFYKQFEVLTSEIKACIDKSDIACSRNMSMQMTGKISVIFADIIKMNVLIDSGARAAYTAATSYESIDKALAKQISTL